MDKNLDGSMVATCVCLFFFVHGSHGDEHIFLKKVKLTVTIKDVIILGFVLVT